MSKEKKMNCQMNAIADEEVGRKHSALKMPILTATPPPLVAATHAAMADKLCRDLCKV